jgi:hypothetical protein
MRIEGRWKSRVLLLLLLERLRLVRLADIVRAVIEASCQPFGIVRLIFVVLSRVGQPVLFWCS